MSSNQPSHTLAVSEAAEAIGITIHSLRRWCEWHAMYLSHSANPPAGQARRLDGRDVEVLRHVKALRGEGLQTVAINDKLSGLTFAEIDNPIAEGNNVPAMDSTISAIEPAQAGQGEAATALVVVEAMRSEMAALRALVVDTRKGQRDSMQAFALGFIAALAFVILILLLFMLRNYL